MAQQQINVGSSANDGTGDSLRTAGIKINDNFDELYNQLAGLGLATVATTGDYNDLLNIPTNMSLTDMTVTNSFTIGSFLFELDGGHLIISSGGTRLFSLEPANGDVIISGNLTQNGTP